MIAFVSERDGNEEIYVMNADGSDQQRLTDNESSDWGPAWAPDGDRIAFAPYRWASRRFPPGGPVYKQRSPWREGAKPSNFLVPITSSNDSAKIGRGCPPRNAKRADPIAICDMLVMLRTQSTHATARVAIGCLVIRLPRMANECSDRIDSVDPKSEAQSS